MPPALRGSVRLDSQPELDIEDPPALLAYLRRRGLVDGDRDPAIRVLAGGVSNRTVLVTDCAGPDLVIKQALPKLRVPDEWFCSTERIHREAIAIDVLQRLEPRGIVPSLVFEDRSNHILAMSAVPQPHENFKTQLPRALYGEDAAPAVASDEAFARDPRVSRRVPRRGGPRADC